ncbi:MAG: 5'/3'-nucleotidase SurE [Thermodesulfobacteriota bacterium]
MSILVTNDDGIFAKGLWALQEALMDICRVTVIAPDRERSAVGHGITLHEPIRADRIRLNDRHWGYAVSGTPADCIKLGLLELLEEKPAIVVSGINPGANLGVNVNYSGTVAAAKEAALYGIPAMAVSISNSKPNYYEEVAGFAKRLAETILRNGLPVGTFLNVNCPDMPVKDTSGVRVSRQNTRFFQERIEKKMDPRNRPYYWQGCDGKPDLSDPDIDSDALCGNYISITPIKCDMTDYDMLENLRGWKID